MSALKNGVCLWWIWQFFLPPQDPHRHSRWGPDIWGCLGKNAWKLYLKPLNRFPTGLRSYTAAEWLFWVKSCTYTASPGEPPEGSKQKPQSQFRKKTWTSRTSRPSPLCNEGASGYWERLSLQFSNLKFQNLILQLYPSILYTFKCFFDFFKKKLSFFGHLIICYLGENLKVSRFLLEKRSRFPKFTSMSLKRFNNFLWVQKFQMELGQSVVAYLQQGDVLPSVDIKHAYLHIPFLWFSGEYWHFFCGP